ncbi:MAG TPA: glycosyltransferase family 87 protein [Anaeromyxobacteraceae bacterium]|nr:glycosyltransferase family 87 protein [Anaeromyxobacteraceae bacterium]
MGAWLRDHWSLFFLALVLAGMTWETRRFGGTDFAVYRCAGGNFCAGRHLYGEGFRYLPGTAALFAPFHLLRYSTAKLLWAALSAGLLAVTAAHLHRRLRTRQPVAAALATVALFHPIAQELQLGQVHLFVLACAVAAFAAEDAGRPWLAGALLAFPFSLKVAPVLLVGDAVLRRRWRVVAGFAAGMSVVLALPVLSHGRHGFWTDHAEWLASQSRLTTALLDNHTNQSLFAIVHRLGAGPVLCAVAALVVTAAAVSVRDLELRRALCLTAIPLVTPNGWVQSFVMAMPLTAILLTRPSRIAWAALTLALGTGLLAYDTLGASGETWALKHGLLGLDLLALFALGLWVAVADRASSLQQPARAETARIPRLDSSPAAR